MSDALTPTRFARRDEVRQNELGYALTNTLVALRIRMEAVGN